MTVETKKKIEENIKRISHELEISAANHNILVGELKANKNLLAEIFKDECESKIVESKNENSEG